MKYSIGIIDDDSAKITQLLTFIKLAFSDEDGNLLKEKYKDIELIPYEIPLDSKIDKMIDKIYKDKPDALVIDFKLSSQQNISYSGVNLALSIDKKLKGFPIFILTSYQDDLYERSNFDVYQVFDFERYINESAERIEINSKIVEQIKKYNTAISLWEEELVNLLPFMGKGVKYDERILELDNLLENSIDGESALSPMLKKELCNSDRIQQLIDKIDCIIDN